MPRCHLKKVPNLVYPSTPKYFVPFKLVVELGDSQIMFVFGLFGHFG